MLIVQVDDSIMIIGTGSANKHALEHKTHRKRTPNEGVERRFAAGLRGEGSHERNVFSQTPTATSNIKDDSGVRAMDEDTANVSAGVCFLVVLLRFCGDSHLKAESLSRGWTNNREIREEKPTARSNWVALPV